MCASTTVDETTTEMGRREGESVWARIAANPTPAAYWAGVGFVLLAVQFGAFVAGVMAIADAVNMAITATLDVIISLFAPGIAGSIVDVQQEIKAFLSGIRNWGNTLPTLLSRETIPNQGYRTGANGPWKETFMGLEPAYAWAIRNVLILAYSVFSFYWLFRGWLVFRENYRNAKWTPTDDIVDRLRGHRWAEFGIVVIIVFLTMALFGPAMGPSTVEQNIQSPYSYQLQYFNEETGEVDSIAAGDANFYSKSKGAGSENVGPMEYDDYDRFHPFGTLQNGRDLYTFMMGGARISLIVSGIAIGLGSFIAVLAALVSSYYAGNVDLATLTIADGITSVPQLLLIILASVVFANHWLGTVMDGGMLLALLFGFTSWPGLWRAVRGPALQVAQESWVDAAKSYGQRPLKTMRKHMLPYVLGYLLVYASMALGGIVIGLASLSFLGNGLGIQPPTPAWGRAVAGGQGYVSTQSWHISFIPGVMIVLLVTGLNAFGDGLRDAIDPESEGGGEEEAAAGGTAA